MRKIEGLESAGAVTSVGSFIMARQVEMGDFRYLAQDLPAFYVIAAVSGAIVVATEIIKRTEIRQALKK